jgi:hypothetical protein
MQPVFAGKAERLIQERPHIKIQDGSKEKELLEGNIEQNVPIGLFTIPTGVAKHKGGYVQCTKQREQAQPFRGAPLLLPPFDKQE